MGKSGAAPRRRPDPGARQAEAGEALRAERGRAAAAESQELDSIVHHRMRLGIVSALAANESLTFNELKALLSTSDGNLSAHARKLEEARYVTCTKSFEGRRPRTEYRLAPSGRRALQSYLEHMEALIQATRDTIER